MTLRKDHVEKEAKLQSKLDQLQKENEQLRAASGDSTAVASSASDATDSASPETAATAAAAVTSQNAVSEQNGGGEQAVVESATDEVRCLHTLIKWDNHVCAIV